MSNSLEVLSERIDFTIDLAKGVYQSEPVDQVNNVLISLAQAVCPRLFEPGKLCACCLKGV